MNVRQWRLDFKISMSSKYWFSLVEKGPSKVGFGCLTFCLCHKVFQVFDICVMLDYIVEHAKWMRWYVWFDVIGMQTWLMREADLWNDSRVSKSAHVEGNGWKYSFVSRFLIYEKCSLMGHYASMISRHPSWTRLLLMHCRICTCTLKYGENFPFIEYTAFMPQFVRSLKKFSSTRVLKQSCYKTSLRWLALIF